MHISGKGSLRALGFTLAWVAAYGAISVAHYVVRGYADDLGRATYSPGTIDAAIIGRSAASWLQHAIPDRGSMPLVIVALYASWFLMLTLLQCVVLARSGPRAVLQLLALHAAVLVVADACFVLWPTRPPWMEAGVTRVIAGAGANPHSIPDNNAFAAFPSLHVAMPCLYAIWFARREDLWLRRIAPSIAAWALAIAFAVIYGAEHYIADVAGGVACAVAVYGTAAWLQSTLPSPLLRTAAAPVAAATTAEAAGG